MTKRTAALVVAAVLAWQAPAARAQITVNLPPGSFTYQFADPATGTAISGLSFTAVGQSKQVAVYLLQTGGTPADLLNQLGAEALGGG
jgi:hypothetical protein